MILRNINSRIRHTGYTEKEVFFRRDLLNNTPLQVTDETISEKIKENRQQSSITSPKKEPKTKTITPPQNLNIGSLVFLRNGKTKNNPRELYIVEDKEDNFLLIRKFNGKLRNKLYRALPAELILAPSSDQFSKPPFDPGQVTDTPPLIKSNSDDSTQLLSRSGRPIRNAARKAHNIANVNSSTKSKQKHGWNEEDQYSDTDYYPILLPSYSSVPSDDPEHTLNEDNSSTSNIDSDSAQELTWDEIPLQLEILKSVSSPPTLPPLPLEDRVALTRRMATSEQSLVRSDAFRRTDASRVPIFNRPFPTRLFYRSRIPTPTSPTNVDLNRVNDLINLPYPIPAVPQPLSDANPRVPRRATQQPSNYKVYGETGRK